MLYPMLTPSSSSTSVVDVFLGYNENPGIGEGEFSFTENLSSDRYPLLSPRKKRGVYASPSGDTPSALISKDRLCYTDGSFFVMGDERIDMGLNGDPKTLLSMGAYVVIMPDKKYINTASPEDRGDVEAFYTSDSEVSFTLCRGDGEEYPQPTLSDEAPSDPQNGDLWTDTSSTPHTLNQYSSLSDMWVAVPTTYIRIGAKGIGLPFEEGDGVRIEGVVAEGLTDLNATFVIAGKGDDYVVVTGITDAAVTQTQPVTLSRSMPDMDFMTLAGNRLWGCRYGLDAEGNAVNEIYASKQGDFKNWHCFGGVATDSYAVAVGTDGPFTGAATHLDNPVFFKENYIHRIYGTYPATYQTQTLCCQGVARGSHKSIATLNGAICYLSPSGVYGYDGSMPVSLSPCLTSGRYGEGVGGVLGNKYYLSSKRLDTGEYSLLVFDTRTGIWQREDATRAHCFCAHGGEMYYYDCDLGLIMTVNGSGMRDESPVKWAAVTGPLGVSAPYGKYLTRINLRMRLFPGSRARILLCYDSEDKWEQVGSLRGHSLRSFSISLPTRRCDHIRLRLEGEGEAEIFSLAKRVEGGSDRP